MKCLRSAEGISNFIISKSSAVLQLHLLHCTPVNQFGLESSRSWLFYRDWKQESESEKRCKKCIFIHLYMLKSKFYCLCFGRKYSRLIWEYSRKHVFINYWGSHFILSWTISVNRNSCFFLILKFSQFLFENKICFSFLKFC